MGVGEVVSLGQFAEPPSYVSLATGLSKQTWFELEAFWLLQIEGAVSSFALIYNYTNFLTVLKCLNPEIVTNFMSKFRPLRHSRNVMHKL